MGFTGASVYNWFATLGTLGKVIHHELCQSDNYLTITSLRPTIVSKFDSIVQQS